METTPTSKTLFSGILIMRVMVILSSLEKTQQFCEEKFVKTRVLKFMGIIRFLQIIMISNGSNSSGETQ